MISPEELRAYYEGDDWTALYDDNPDPGYISERIESGGVTLPLFHGRISLSFWLKAPFPLPSIPVSFWGSPVTDLFPFCGGPFEDCVKLAVSRARKKKSWALIVKDLLSGDPLEDSLSKEGFVPVENDPVWYMPVYKDLNEFLKSLSKGRRKGLEGRWKRFTREVSVRQALEADLFFIKKSYDNVRARSEMRLESLTADFFSAALKKPSCRIFIFEKESVPFAFIMLWKKDGVWFDKYMGTDDTVYREVSFYSMSILHLMGMAPAHGIKIYMAGQGCGKDKEGLGFSKIGVRLWIKPLILNPVLTPIIKRFMKVHNKRVFGAVPVEEGV